MHTVDPLNTARPEVARLPSFEARQLEESHCEPLPERLRRAVEWLSGQDLRDVRVYAESEWPARVGARAFVFGRDIYLSPGAEGALPHEAWHVVQQKQGRVRATGSVRFEESGPEVGLNDEEGLEREADVMGRLARSLALGVEALPARRPAPCAGIPQPVVQRVLEVGQTEYQPRELSGFTKELVTRLGDDLGWVKQSLFAEIVNDFFEENLSFDAWPAVLREVFIRNVGYQVENTMRELLREHRTRHHDAEAKARRLIAQADADWADDEKKNIVARQRFQSRDDYVRFFDQTRADVLKGVIEHGPAAFFSQYSTTSIATPMFQWLMGGTEELPLRMNCWEGVLYALVKTGLVDKTYIAWCNSAGDRSRFEGKEDQPNFTLLQQQCVLDMDYYWGTKDKALNANPNINGKRRESREGFQPSKGESPQFCVPETVTIPRGRLLMFATGEHIALSTGKPRPIEDKATIERFGGMTMGHGMLELDCNYIDAEKTFRESTLEELYTSHRGYLKNLIVTPFPICSREGTIVLTGREIDSSSTEAQEAAVEKAKQKYLEDNSRQIERARRDIQTRIDRYKKVLEGFGDSVPEKEPERAAYLRAEQNYLDARKQYNRIDSDWAKKAMNAREVTRLYTLRSEQTYKQGRLELRYSANDPYQGRVRF